MEVPAPEGGKAAEKKAPPTVFPSIHIEGESANSIMAGKKVGDSFSCMVEFRVVSHSQNAERNEEYGPSRSAGQNLELEAVSFETPEEEESEEEPMETADEAADKFMAERGE